MRLKQEKGEKERAKQTKEAMQQWKKGEKLKVASGKTPFFLKKKAQRKVEIEHKFETVAKGPGGAKRVSKLIEKRRKRNASREKKWMGDRGGQGKRQKT